MKFTRVVPARVNLEVYIIDADSNDTTKEIYEDF